MAIRDLEAGTRTREQGLLDVARLVARNVPEEALFAAVSEQVAAVTGASASSVLRYEGDERAVAVGAWRTGGSRGVPVNAELDFDHTNSALGRVRATRRPARADGYEGVAGELPAVMRSIGLRSTIAAPVMIGDVPWGAVVASTTGDAPLPEGSEYALTGFAELVAQAIVNARARARLVEAADEAARRLETELHEHAQQHVVALALKLRVARARATEELAPLLDDALAEATATTTALRDISRRLHPAVLAERGLAPALLALAARSEVPVYLRELPGRRFPPVVETTIHLLVAEAVRTGAGEVGVRIADRGDRVLVKVTGAAPPDAGLAERVAALGGVLEATEGAVRATLPL
jgi:GAF domain-containing protein